VADQSGEEVTGDAICALFAREYFEADGPAQRVSGSTVRWNKREIAVPATAAASVDGHEAYAKAVAQEMAAASKQTIEIASFETARTTDGRTVVFVASRVGEQPMRHGIGVAEDEMTAVVDAVVSGVNRAGWAAADRRVAA